MNPWPGTFATRRHANKPRAFSLSVSLSRALLVILATTAVLSNHRHRYCAEASISLMNSGTTYPSRMDYEIGQPFLSGFDYMGRLQSLPENPTLCRDPDDPNKKHKVIRPRDGLPVALLVQSGGCSILEKAQVAANLIEPAYAVQYVILQDSDKRHRSHTTLGDHGNDNGNDNDNYIDNSNDNSNDNDNDNSNYNVQNLLFSWITSDESKAESKRDKPYRIDVAAVERGGRVLKQHLPTDRSIASTDHLLTDHQTQQDRYQDRSDSGYYDDIDLAVMHVSKRVGEALFRAIDEDSPSSLEQGGMRILVNRSSEVGVGTVLLWMLVSFVACACACCCMLVVVQTHLDEEEPQPEPPRRPARRKLTLEEVRSRFPSFHFDPREQPQTIVGNINDNRESGVGNAPVTEPKTNPNHNNGGGGGGGAYSQLSDECTICLDEFTLGVRVRELPCGHVFHSTCIARWLIERSAVCPLCKLDLYEEPPDEDEDEDEDVASNNNDNDNGQGQNEQSTLSFSFLRSWWSGQPSNSEGYTALEIPLAEAPSAEEAFGSGNNEALGETDANNNNNANNDNNANANGSPEEEPRSWWPFSLETVPSTDEDEAANARARAMRRRRTPSWRSATGLVSRTMQSVWTTGQRRRHHRHGHRHRHDILPMGSSGDDNNSNITTTNSNGNGNDDDAAALLTELTEPLMAQQHDEVLAGDNEALLSESITSGSSSSTSAEV